MESTSNESKKIIFGFSKIAKKPNIVSVIKKPQNSSDIQLIDSIEGAEIKVRDPIIEKNEPLIISIKGNANNLLGRIEEAAKKNSTAKIDNEPEDNRPDSELTIEELAARELLKEAKARLANGQHISSKVFTLPLAEEKLKLEGAKESSLDDYESVPISDYGMAMLRGMGWKEGTAIGKNPNNKALPAEPEIRPKGLGLGANKMVQNKGQSVDKQGKPLILIKGAYAKAIAGNYKGTYCMIQGFDEDAGRIILKLPNGETISLNEAFAVPVTKEEYSLGSRVINNAKYEQYKERTNKQSATPNSPEEKKYSVQIKEENLDRERSKKYSKSDHKTKKKSIKHKSDSEESDYSYKKRHREKRNRSKSPIKRKKTYSGDSSDSDYKKKSSSSRKNRRRNDSDSSDEKRYSSKKKSSKSKKHKRRRSKIGRAHV